MFAVRRPALSRFLFALTVFGVLLLALTTRVPKWLTDFDQNFYISIAYDLDRYGTFSNGVFTREGAETAPPRPGMFFTPLYPSLVYAAMRIDPRFNKAVSCVVEAERSKRVDRSCEAYALPIHILHAAVLALAALSIGFAAQTVLASRRAFSIAGALATVGFLAEADLFSFVMTESVTVSLFSVATAAWIVGLKTQSTRWLIGAGIALGLLCLARASYLALVPFLILPVVFMSGGLARDRVHAALLFAAAFALVFTPWIARNAISIGKAGISEEYGSAALVERFAFNTMTGSEFALAFPYCIPVIGPPVVKALAGENAMDRFEWNVPGSFFEQGRAQRNALVEQHKRLDPVFGSIMSAEMRERGVNHALVSIPLGWCGLWVSGAWSLLLLPLFIAASVPAARERNWHFFLYALPALVMVGLHAVLANHYARYNLGLIGPYSVGAALLIVRALRWRERANARAA